MIYPSEGLCPGVLKDALGHFSEDTQAVFISHIVGGTSADYLSDWLKRAGYPVGATTLKQYRRHIAWEEQKRREFYGSQKV